MLGRTIRDPYAVESRGGGARGIGLLDADTVFFREKTLHQVEFSLPGEKGVMRGYEIHMGQTRKSPGLKPLFHIQKRSGEDVREEEGALNAEGNVMGTYIHGLLANDAFRHGLLTKLAARKGLRLAADELLKNYEGLRRKNWDRLADWAQNHLDMQVIDKITGIPR